MLPDFKTYYKSTEVKTVVLARQQTYRSMERNRVQKQTHTHTLDFLEKGIKSMGVKTKFFCLTNGSGTEYTQGGKSNFDPYSAPYTRSNYRKITDLNIKAQTIKSLEQNA